MEVERANDFSEEKIRQRTQELTSANQALEQLARKDPLTGCFNRLAAREQLNSSFKQLRQYGQTYSLLLLNIDHFKRINDTFGHALGDQALQSVAHLIHQALRQNDNVFRMGGEEFMVLLPNTGEAVAQYPQPNVGTITVSLGLSVANIEDRDDEQAIHRADEALYAAKAAGRNNVQIR